MSDAPIWALIVRMPCEELSARVAAGSDQFPLDRWAIVDGKGNHSALISYDPGSEGIDANLARALSVSGTEVYDVRFSEDVESVRVFVKGAYARELDAAPHEFAATHGIDVGGVEHARGRSVLVIEGAQPSEVTAALALEPGEALHVDAVPVGAIVYSDAGDVSPLLRLVAGKLPTRTVYLLAYLPGSHFVAQTVRGDEDVGVLYAPPHEDPLLPTMHAVHGEHDPLRIAQALGVPPGLLELPEST